MEISLVFSYHYNDMLPNSSNPQFKPVFKTMDHFGGLKNRISKAKTSAQKDKGLSVD